MANSESRKVDRKPMVLSLILAAMVITAAFFGTKLSRINLAAWMPRPADLATSPLTRQLAVEKNNPAPAAATAPVKIQPASMPASLAETDAVRPAVAAPDDSDKEEIKVPAKPDAITVEKLGVDAPIVTPNTRDAALLKKLLDEGAVLYPDSVKFGGRGQTILLGHSAPANWPDIKHDTIFSRISELAPGDKITAIYGGKEYRYSVLQSRIIEKGGDIPAISTGGGSLVLVTCWPPGRDLKRLVVEAQLEIAD